MDIMISLILRLLLLFLGIYLISRLLFPRKKQEPDKKPTDTSPLPKKISIDKEKVVDASFKEEDENNE